MIENEINEIIAKLPQNNPYHSKSNDYKEELFNKLKLLTLQNIKLNEKVEKLLIGENTNPLKSLFTYNQGISELLWWFFLDKNEKSYKIEEKMVSGKNTNIDVQFVLLGVTYNIEIKSPEYPQKNNSNLYGRAAYRVPGGQIIEALKEISNEFRKGLGNTEYNDVDEDLPNDNKIKDCLLSAQKKFVENSKSICNILYISTIDDELFHYINYFFNPNSGFFTPNSYIPHSDFDNVKAVILSNAISMNHDEVGKGWDLANSLNLIFSNPFCKYSDTTILDELFCFFPNLTKEYYIDLAAFIDREKQKALEFQLPIECFYLEFIKKYSMAGKRGA